ncbi:hypothetical protein PV08_01560 [Exophiala spinifera]|uniref:Pre-mRNA-processing factor 19 n=1 Tax=Exophiala spinifera TaxID=91928 RepID=A0A0D1Z0A0_9EURO|nr:uncharacterized protein PV08_01560 [Exophiala spinifera]KIW20981.1 hypothetical protein PV08_01560 [Exophiala spinifera]
MQNLVAVSLTISGNVYEKRLIEAFISENGTEPTTGAALTTEDLLEIKTQPNVTPRPPQMTSVPAMLSMFQNEWDSMALQVYKLQQDLKEARRELSVAMYQQDAARRVIAKIAAERDEARAALSKVSVGRGAPSGDAMEVDNAPLPETILGKIDSEQQRLSKTRRKRPVPEDWATADSISAYVPVTSSEPMCTGGTVLAVHESGDLAIVAGHDTNATVFSLSQNRPLQLLNGGSGKVTSGVWAQDNAVIATSTGVVKVFEAEKEVASFSTHGGSVNGIALHASGSILASVGDDKTYTLYDLEGNQKLTQIQSDSALTCVQFHPDGHLLAAGAVDGQIKIFDVKTGSSAATFDLRSPIKCVFFSENGTWLAGVTEGSSSISIWDLRKGAEIKSIETGGPIESISWDYTGQFLASVGARGITVEQYSKASKEWSEVFKSATPGEKIAWGKNAQQLLHLSDQGVLTAFGTGKQE